MVHDGVQWTTRSDDAEFLRRVTLDLTGEVPDVDTVKAFLADTDANKRDKAIDRLIASPAFVDRWDALADAYRESEGVTRVSAIAGAALVIAAELSITKPPHDPTLLLQIRDRAASPRDNKTAPRFSAWCVSR